MTDKANKGFKPATDFEDIEERQELAEPQISEELAEDIDPAKMYEKIKELTDIVTRTNTILNADNLDPEMKSKIKIKTSKIFEVYKKIAEISVMDVSDVEKFQESQEVLGGIPFVIIEHTNSEIEKTEAIIDKIANERIAEEEQDCGDIKRIMEEMAAENAKAAEEKLKNANDMLEKAISTKASLPMPVGQSMWTRIRDSLKENRKEWKPEMNKEKQQIELMYNGEIKYIISNASKKSGEEIKKEIDKVQKVGVIGRVIDVVKKAKEEEKEILRKVDEERTEKENGIEEAKEKVKECTEGVKESKKSRIEIQELFREVKSHIEDRIKSGIKKIKEMEPMKIFKPLEEEYKNDFKEPSAKGEKRRGESGPNK